MSKPRKVELTNIATGEKIIKNSVAEAALYVKSDAKNISLVLKGDVGHRQIKGWQARYVDDVKPSGPVIPETIHIQDLLKESDLQAYLLKNKATTKDLAMKFKTSEASIERHMTSLKELKYNIITQNNEHFIDILPPTNTRHSFNLDMWKGDVLKFGFTSDNHMGSVHERMDVLNLLYDIFADEGCEVVYNAGNMIDDEAPFNKNELHTRGMTKQVEYFANNYPYRKGVTTKFIAGDDHEGWYQQREGINIGEYMLMKRIQAGYNDMEYLGYMEADVELTDDGFENKSWLRVCHPGGGSAYALSYTSQKIAESLQGGEKPAVMLLGHYHKIGYEYPREIHSIQTGTTENQTLFMRKKRLQAMLGGGTCTLRRAKDGTINRCSVEFTTFFDNKFYKGNTKYWN
jgi:hypothetical protein